MANETKNKRRSAMNTMPYTVGPIASSLISAAHKMHATWLWAGGETPGPAAVPPGQDVVFSLFVEPLFAMAGRVEPSAGFIMYVEPLWAGTTIIGD